MGDANHPTGVVLAEIVKANIPVRNGVVHLIQRPLMVVDTTVKDFLEVSARSCFPTFSSNIETRDIYNQFNGKLNGCDNNATRNVMFYSSPSHHPRV